MSPEVNLYWSTLTLAQFIGDYITAPLMLEEFAALYRGKFALAAHGGLLDSLVATSFEYQFELLRRQHSDRYAGFVTGVVRDRHFPSSL